MFFVTELQSKPTRNPEITNKVCRLIFDKTDDKKRKEIASKLGLSRDSLTHKKNYCFYVLSPTKRALAIHHGAVEILSNEVMSNIEGQNND